MCLIEEINQGLGRRQRPLNLFKLRVAETGNVTNDFIEQVFQHSATLLLATSNSWQPTQSEVRVSFQGARQHPRPDVETLVKKRENPWHSRAGWRSRQQ